jgi:hypothetical protein
MCFNYPMAQSAYFMTYVAPISKQIRQGLWKHTSISILLLGLAMVGSELCAEPDAILGLARLERLDRGQEGAG